MRLAKTFSRWKGGGGTPALGSDMVPNGPAGTPGTPPDSVTMDNLLVARPVTTYGIPGVLFVASYNFVGAGPSTVTMSLYLWDELSLRWLRTDAAPVPSDHMGRFRIVTPSAEPMAGEGALLRPSQGNLQALLIVTDTGAAGTGEHVFGMGIDASEG